MVKISAVLGGLLVLFASTHGFLNITVSCVIHWIEVKVTQFVAIGNLPLQAYELFLGSGCPVSYRDQDIFVFFYILSSCGIRVHELPHGTVIESSIIYSPIQLGITLHYPISCFIPRDNLVLLMVLQLNTLEGDLTVQLEVMAL